MTIKVNLIPKPDFTFQGQGFLFCSAKNRAEKERMKENRGEKMKLIKSPDKGMTVLCRS